MGLEDKIKELAKVEEEEALKDLIVTTFYVLSSPNIPEEVKKKVKGIALIEHVKKLLKEGKIEKEKIKEVLEEKKSIEEISKMIKETVTTLLTEEKAVKEIEEEAKKTLEKEVENFIKEELKAKAMQDPGAVTKLLGLKEEQIQMDAYKKIDKRIEELEKKIKDLEIYKEVFDAIRELPPEKIIDKSNELYQKLPEDERRKIEEDIRSEEALHFIPTIALSIYRKAKEEGKAITPEEAIEKAEKIFEEKFKNVIKSKMSAEEFINYVKRKIVELDIAAGELQERIKKISEEKKDELLKVYSSILSGKIDSLPSEKIIELYPIISRRIISDENKLLSVATLYVNRFRKYLEEEKSS